MNTRNICTLIVLTYVIIQVLATSCATVSSPTGGPKDTIPPRLVNSRPNMGALQFNEKTMRLEFTEAIQLKDFKNQLIITPTVEGKYKTRVNNRTLDLIFDENFAENTTYTFSFREGIADITEGNPVQDLRIAFSTGSHLDSLRISGQIQDLKTNKAIEDALVSLYRAEDTLTTFNGRPYYLTKTDKQGNYQFGFLKPGRYRIYATKDENKNLVTDSRTEKFGFLRDTINLRSDIDSLNIEIQRINAEPIVLNAARPSGLYYELNLNKGIKSYSLQPLIQTNSRLHSNMVEENKKVRVYNTVAITDSLPAYFMATDSLGQQLQDTVYIRFEESRRSKEPFTLSINPKTNSAIQENFEATISFTKPVLRVNLDSLFFQYDSLTQVRPDTAKDFTWNTQRDKLQINTRLSLPTPAAENTSNTGNTDNIQTRGPATQGVTLYMGQTAFMSVENDSSAAQTVKYTFADPKNFGSIQGQFNTTAQNYIIQLVQSSNFSVVKEIRNQADFLFRMVPPGEYRIRILIDSNGNGEWEPGNIHKRIEPEPVIHLDEPITMKANWEVRDIVISE